MGAAKHPGRLCVAKYLSPAQAGQTSAYLQRRPTEMQCTEGPGQESWVVCLELHGASNLPRNLLRRSFLFSGYPLIAQCTTLKAARSIACDRWAGEFYRDFWSLRPTHCPNTCFQPWALSEVVLLQTGFEMHFFSPTDNHTEIPPDHWPAPDWIVPSLFLTKKS